MEQKEKILPKMFLKRLQGEASIRNQAYTNINIIYIYMYVYIYIVSIYVPRSSRTLQAQGFGFSGRLLSGVVCCPLKLRSLSASRLGLGPAARQARASALQ